MNMKKYSEIITIQILNSCLMLPGILEDFGTT